MKARHRRAIVTGDPKRFPSRSRSRIRVVTARSRIGLATFVIFAFFVLSACGTSTPNNSASTTWLTYGYDARNTRTNLEPGDISGANVGSLHAVWSKDGIVGVVGTPTVSKGTAYFADQQGTVWAVTASSGRVLWKTKVSPGVVGAAVIGGSLVYVGSSNTLYALNRSTGAIKWKTITNTNPFAQISASPVLVDNLVIEGTASYEVTILSKTYSFQGSIGAFNAATGRQVWNFVATPNNASSGAGEGIWSTPAVDKKLGLLFIGTGQNLAPPPGPLEDSILALEIKTGKLRWSMQGFKNDVFSAGYPTGHDYDFGASPNLWSSNGREIVGDGEKSGSYFALDAATGRVIWKRTLTPGGSFGGVLGSGAYVDDRLIVSANVGNASPNETKVFALNPSDGAIEWSRHLEGNIYGPVSAIPNVAFVGTDTGTDSGQMTALDTATGATLWRYDAPGPVACGPSIVEGRVLWGYGYLLFSGPGPGGIISFAASSGHSR
jgi:polyvinyl alcohol dehydrogenase (cytochrome)